MNFGYINSNDFANDFANRVPYQESVTAHGPLITRRSLNLAVILLMAKIIQIYPTIKYYELFKKVVSQNTDKATVGIQKIQERADVIFRKTNSQIRKEKIVHIKKELKLEIEQSTLKHSSEQLCKELTTQQQIQFRLGLAKIQMQMTLVKEDEVVYTKSLVKFLMIVEQENQLKIEKEFQNYAAIWTKIYGLEEKLALLVNENVLKKDN